MSGKKLVGARSAGRLESGAALFASQGLAPELVREAKRRLELTSLLVAAVFGVVIVLNNAFRAAGWYSVPRPDAHNVVATAVIALSAGLFWALRRTGPTSGRVLTLGLVYEVAVAFAISLGDHFAPLSTEHPLTAVSWLCVWIVMFPLVVPVPPRRALLASLAAATTWPVAFAVGLGLGQPAPPARVVLLNVLEGYIAALLALGPSLILRRLAADLQRAREMGSYELVERLGHGGMGEVWRAKHRMLARPAAIKLIRPEALGADREAAADSLVRRFEREAQATALLHSPHTIELYDFGIAADGTFYYVMELLEGVDFEVLVQRFGPVPAERAVHLLLQACDSLADAHHVGLVHRDIKPANLYLCRRGLRYDFVKVLDFGLVKSSWREGARDTRLTMEGTAGGTPAYMAPEVALGEQEIDARVDLYAFGCVGYWLLTGHTVFDGQTPMQMALQHLHSTPVPPSRRTELPIPPALERLLLSCLEKDRERRPASAEGLASALAGCPLEEPWTQERARRWWETNLPRAVPPAPAALDDGSTIVRV